MAEEPYKKIQSALELLFSIKGLEEFYNKHYTKSEIKNISDFHLLLERVKEFLAKENRLNERERTILSLVRETSESTLSLNTALNIRNVNSSLKPKEDFIKKFIQEFNETKTGQLFIEELVPKRFKTISEVMALHAVERNKLNEIYEKYIDHNHPFIYYVISEPKIQSKDFSLGISILKKALKYAFRHPNHFWHSNYGVEGCAWSLYQIQYLLGRDGISTIEKEIPTFRFTLLKLIFLYLSRYIYMTDRNVKVIDFYSNRARLVKDYYLEFSAIFGLGVNPDIQFISDNYFAYQISVEFGLSGFPQFKQHFWESMKMYRHGHHIPNSSGGYQEIEDRTWMELVRDGEFRSINLAESILNEFEGFKLNIDNQEIDFICDTAMDKNKDDYENYLNDLNKNK